MSTHKHIDRLCAAAMALCLLLTVLFMGGEMFGIEAAAQTMGYEETLFSTDKVHTIDISIDDWEGFLSTAQSEEYSVCDVTIDGETVKNVGIRGKGNTSLSSVAAMDSDRYSFKIEFDQYDSTQNYHGLDKLCLNNLIQDNTYMKDYLTYQMMNAFGAAAPLCSFVFITVNGENWGLYLAVEAVEESFLQRNYGSNFGDLYKPDSMSFGGGRGNGKDFDMGDFAGDWDFDGEMPSPGGMPQMGEMPDFSGEMPDMGQMPQFPDDMPDMGQMPQFPDDMPDMGQMPQFPDDMPQNFGGFGGGRGMGMGSSDVKLQYIDDDPASYPNIFDNAKTDVTQADENRLIASLKQLSAYENLEEVISIDAVLRYFVVHNFVVNGDSYTGSMIHNYYLYEKDGRMAMIPWDYNLGYGTFMGGNGASSVNSSIHEVLSDRPMQAWIFSDDRYAQQYDDLYSQFLTQVDPQSIIQNAYDLIVDYVSMDPSAFCTHEEFTAAVTTLQEFCSLRAESVSRQLAGNNEAVDTGTLNISAMGTMGGMGGGFGGNRGSGEKPTFSPDGGNADQDTQRPSKGDFSGMMPSQQTKGNASTIITLAATALILTVGLIIAFKFKR